MYTHIVSFKFASHVTDATRDEVHSRMTALKTECKLDGGKGATYIASLTGGKKNISPEGKGHGFDVGVVEVVMVLAGLRRCTFLSTV